MSLCRYCQGAEHSGSCDREALKKRITDWEFELSRKDMELQATRKIGEKGVIMVTSLISHRTTKPRIDIQLGELHTQMSADAAMDVAKNIIEVSEGAYADGFIFHFLTEKLNQSTDVAAQIIQEFRAYREELAREFKQEQEEG
jgi:hypothetical protein